MRLCQKDFNPMQYSRAKAGRAEGMAQRFVVGVVVIIQDSFFVQPSLCRLAWLQTHKDLPAFAS